MFVDVFCYTVHFITEVKKIQNSRDFDIYYYLRDRKKVVSNMRVPKYSHTLEDNKPLVGNDDVRYPWTNPSILFSYESMIKGDVSISHENSSMRALNLSNQGNYPRNAELILVWGDMTLPESRIRVISDQFDSTFLPRAGQTSLREQMGFVLRTPPLMFRFPFVLCCDGCAKTVVKTPTRLGRHI